MTKGIFLFNLNQSSYVENNKQNKNFYILVDLLAT